MLSIGVNPHSHQYLHKLRPIPHNSHENGPLEEACSLKDFVPGYMQVEEIKKAAEKIGVKKGIKKGKKEGKIDIAKNWKENGVDISLIAKSAGLSKEEIEKL
jgi:predicted transposase/invertase (TIGR01784 family)